MSDELNQEQEVTLPSDEVVAPTIDDYISANTSDNGKLFGRFDDVASALDHFREQEIKHTNNMREIKEGQKEVEQKQSEQAAKAEAEQTRVAKINELVPQMLENNMSITDEMKTVMEEAGLSQAEIELGAYKVRDITQKAFAVYGGQEKFEQVKAWAEENLDEATKRAFDINMGDMVQGKEAVGILAMEGLLSRYEKANAGEIQPVQRVEGTPTGRTSTRGYASQAEMFKDKRAADNDPKLRAAYQAKLNQTADNIIYGR